MWMGESLLGYGKVLDPAEVERRLLAVTPEEVRAVAEFCLQKGALGMAMVGPTLPDGTKVLEWVGRW